ncbi:hypothetical protein GN244_ATG06487 [Phytophthora infestans]|uniref:Uncharacterized protein n=1 Tax=Phytophthora infestans TaxID=4787 RepID=A0A833T7T3_PHYIN|nr:hypothetical protein GN244_ATG06487 [Phytophthora infestans]KAF4149716.1 hypothetical protein GN958_ATG01112 [Phytophthora infestans]
MRVACSHLRDTFDETEEGELELLRAFSKTIGVYYDSTHNKECLQLNAPSNEDTMDSNFWNHIYCAELYGPTITDMFWSAPLNFTTDNASCHAEWDIDARIMWPTAHYGGRLQATTSSATKTTCTIRAQPQACCRTIRTVVAVHIIEGGAHHLDLIFSTVTLLI